MAGNRLQCLKEPQNLFILIDCLADSGTAKMYKLRNTKWPLPPIKGQCQCCTGKQGQLFKCKAITIRNMENSTWNIVH